MRLYRERPKNILASTTVDGVLFFVRDEDEWFFGDADLCVDIENDDIRYVISPTGMRVNH